MDAAIHELTAGYALDALDPDERAAYASHLPGCAACQEELASFAEVTAALAVAAAGPAPGAGLRERIVAAARAEPQTVVPFERRRSRSSLLAAAGAIAAVIAIVFATYSISLRGDLGDARSALSSQEQLTVVLADPGARTIAVSPGTGKVVVAPDGEAVLVLSGLDAPPEGKTYQAWVVRGEEQPVPAATFEPDGGSAVVAIGEPVTKDAVVGVTLEDDAGASTPTLPMVAASQPV